MKNTLMLSAFVAIMMQLTAQQFSMVEINPQQGTELFLWNDSSKHVYGSGEFNSFVQLNGRLYFAAQNSYYNYELWSTDGTQAGTQLVKELNTSGGSGIGQLHKVGNKIVFAATEDSLNGWNAPGYDLYVSDGTTQGTFKLMDLNESSSSFLENNRVAVINGRFVFCTSTHVVATDGTVSGSVPLAAIAQYAQGYGYCEMNGSVYFILVQNGQPEVWKSDGTAAGTALVKNLSTANVPISYVDGMKAFNNRLYIVGSVSGQGNDLYVFDGTSSGIVIPVSLAPGSNAYPTDLEVYAGKLWFVASNMAGVNIYKMETTDIAPVIVSSAVEVDNLSELAFANNKVYYGVNGMSTIHSIDVATLQHTKLDLQDKRLPWFWNNGAPFLVGLGNNIFFIAYDSLHQQQYFMMSDGTTAGTQSFAPAGSNTQHPFNALLSCGMADVFDFAVFGNKVVVPANFNDAGRELWFFEKEGVVNSVETPDAGSFTVFPNPANNILMLKMDDATAYCDHQIEVIDVNGKKWVDRQVTGNETAIELVHIPSGSYIAVVKTANSQPVIQKFLVIK